MPISCRSAASCSDWQRKASARILTLALPPDTDGVGKVFTHDSTGPGRPPPSPTLNSRARLEEDYRCLGADAPGRLGGGGGEHLSSSGPELIETDRDHRKAKPIPINREGPGRPSPPRRTSARASTGSSSPRYKRALV